MRGRRSTSRTISCRSLLWAISTTLCQHHTTSAVKTRTHFGPQGVGACTVRVEVVVELWRHEGEERLHLLTPVLIPLVTARSPRDANQLLTAGRAQSWFRPRRAPSVASGVAQTCV
jgi:hypothetical protein